MPEPLKNLYNKAFVNKLGSAIKKEFSDFNLNQFTKDVLFEDWELLELKQRTEHVTAILGQHLAVDYQQALDILKPVSSQFSGLECMVFPDFVAKFGLDHFAPSMDALAIFTQYSTSEFAVRPFIVKYGDKMMKQMLQWSYSSNEHIRRLASEGCRPRLPWGFSLKVFKENPDAIFPILENLKQDDSEYVRRSVANNLNDISKDHPERVLEISQKWLGNNQATDRLVKHACRTLLKLANPEALLLFGYSSVKHIELKNIDCSIKVLMGEELRFNFELLSKTEDILGKLRIEYAIVFYRPSKKQGRKVFKISEGDFGQQYKKVTKKHSFRSITTRRYYSGEHRLEIIVNGQTIHSSNFELI